MPGAEEPLLRVEALSKDFRVRGSRRMGRRTERLRAVDEVSLDVWAGETLGVVGESGCGKSTLAACMVRLEEPTAGRIVFDGRDITRLGGRAMRHVRRDLQIVFQDPYASLNPRHRVADIVAAPLRIHGVSGVRSRVAELLDLVGLDPSHARRFPHEFSGGQRQRIGIARALAVSPKLIVADEPVSALDVSVQAQIVNLFDDLKQQLGLTYVFIAHDLSVVHHVSDRVAVMYLGRLVELAPAGDLYAAPAHPYAEALLSAVPVPDPDQARASERIVLRGDVPSPLQPPSGCAFHPRCRYATDRCRVEAPPLLPQGDQRLVACHHPRSPSAPAGSRMDPAAPRMVRR